MESAQPQETIYICSDNQGPLNALSSAIFDSAQNLESSEALDNLASTNGMELIWVPSHSKIVGYDKADELAKKVEMRRLIGPELT